MAAFLAGQTCAEQVFDTGKIETWADGYFGGIVENGNVSGAVVSIVSGGEVVLSRAYGLDNVESGAAASPITTRVRIGSTTKTFTAAIIAQLIEEGRIGSVDDPVNSYLERVKLPDNDGVEITLRHLLTHTAGFADRFYFIGARSPVPVPATPRAIRSLRPEYVRPAGARIVYSNFGVAVLGYVIEDTTGKNIEQAMQERLFEPLGMTSTNLAVTVDEPYGLAKPGVIDTTGVVGPTPFTAINPAVAQTGSVVSTAEDMSKYVRALLGHGDTFGQSVRERLFAPLAGNARQLTKLGMVFFVDEWAGHRVLSHGGNWAGFHSWMTLLPDDDVGVFVSLLSEPLPDTLVERFLRATFPASAPPPSPAIVSAYTTYSRFLADFLGPKRALPTEAQRSMPPIDIDGVYRADRRPFETIEAASSLVYFGADTVDVVTTDEGLYFGGAGPWLHDGANGFVLDVPTRPMLAVIPGVEGGPPAIVPDIGIYTFSRIATLSDPRLHAVIIHAVVPLTLIGLVALLWLGKSRRAIAPAGIGFFGLVMVLLATVALEPGASLMTGYYAGQPLRLVLFVVAANLQAIAGLASLPALKDSALSTPIRWTIGFLIVLVVISVAIFSQHNILGFHRI